MALYYVCGNCTGKWCEDCFHCCSCKCTLKDEEVDEQTNL